MWACAPTCRSQDGVASNPIPGRQWLGGHPSQKCLREAMKDVSVERERTTRNAHRHPRAQQCGSDGREECPLVRPE